MLTTCDQVGGNCGETGKKRHNSLVSGVMMLNLFCNDFCVMYGLWEFDLALCQLQMPFGSD